MQVWKSHNKTYHELSMIAMLRILASQEAGTEVLHFRTPNLQSELKRLSKEGNLASPVSKIKIVAYLGTCASKIKSNLKYVLLIAVTNRYFKLTPVIFIFYIY